MTQTKDLRIGIIGAGNMGTQHARSIIDGKIARCRLTAIADTSEQRRAKFPDIKGFADSGDLIRSGAVDAVLIATPHYSHTSVGIEALENGLHVLMEKPISVHKADCERLIVAHRKNDRQIFGAMFNQRTDPHYRKVRQLVQSGELGSIRRINWIITNWFRTEAYYASGGWRATWKGEGGGVLLNQCPHQLDLFQWMFGMPSQVRAFCGFGRYHDIEVEDDVTAYFQYEDGANAVFIANTGEAPGTNRLEVIGDRGKLVVEDDRLTFLRNEVSMTQFSRQSDKAFARPPHWVADIPISGHGGQHNEVLNNFVDAVLDGAELIAPGVEGIHSVELANAMLLSAFREATIDLPMDGAEYEAALQERIKNSTFQKKAVRESVGDFSKSFNT